MVLRDHPNDFVSRLDGVMMPNHLCALAEGKFENISRKFLLPSFTDLTMGYTPHVSDENHILQCRHFAAEFTEYIDVR